jgi:GNAT superfamily N-acetyltransferase
MNISDGSDMIILILGNESKNKNHGVEVMRVDEVSLQNEKKAVCNEILRTLPEWFGIESSIVEYVEEVQSLPFFVAWVESQAIGFAALKIHNDYTAEVYVMGVLSEYHRQGVGLKLIEKCEEYVSLNDFKFLTVKTLAASRESEPYRKTRKFYERMGFYPLEVFPLLWDEANPCLFLAKAVRVGGCNDNGRGNDNDL